MQISCNSPRAVLRTFWTNATQKLLERQLARTRAASDASYWYNSLAEDKGDTALFSINWRL